MKLLAQFTIIGKQVTFEAIKSFKRNIPKDVEVETIGHILLTAETTTDYINQISSMVDHVTITNINYCGHSMILPMLFFQYDWFLDLADDVVWFDGGVQKYLAIGACSDPKKPIKNGMLKNDIEFFPDIAVWYRYQAVQEVGSFCPQFTPYGYQTIELQYRIRKNKWNIYVLANVMSHDKEAHKGRDNIKNFVEMHENNEGLLIKKIADLNTGTNPYWWKNRIKY
jgi:hypothetical protein